MGGNASSKYNDSRKFISVQEKNKQKDKYDFSQKFYNDLENTKFNLCKVFPSIILTKFLTEQNSTNIEEYYWKLVDEREKLLNEGYSVNSVDYTRISAEIRRVETYLEKYQENKEDIEKIQGFMADIDISLARYNNNPARLDVRHSEHNIVINEIEKLREEKKELKELEKELLNKMAHYKDIYVQKGKSTSETIFGKMLSFTSGLKEDYSVMIKMFVNYRNQTGHLNTKDIVSKDESQLEKMQRKSEGLLYEQRAYKYILNNILKNKASPNFVKLLAYSECIMNIGNYSYLLRENKKYIKDLKVINPKEAPVGITLTERVGLGKRKVVTLNELLLYGIEDEDIKKILFQLVYSLSVMQELRIMHNDLHTKNILVEVYEEYPALLRYEFNGKIYTIETHYVPYIYDWDYAYIPEVGINGKIEDIYSYKLLGIENRYNPWYDLHCLLSYAGFPANIEKYYFLNDNYEIDPHGIPITQENYESISQRYRPYPATNENPHPVYFLTRNQIVNSGVNLDNQPYFDNLVFSMVQYGSNPQIYMKPVVPENQSRKNSFTDAYSTPIQLLFSGYFDNMVYTGARFTYVGDYSYNFTRQNSGVSLDETFPILLPEEKEELNVSGVSLDEPSAEFIKDIENIENPIFEQYDVHEFRLPSDAEEEEEEISPPEEEEEEEEELSPPEEEEEEEKMKIYTDEWIDQYLKLNPTDQAEAYHSLRSYLQREYGTNYMNILRDTDKRIKQEQERRDRVYAQMLERSEQEQRRKLREDQEKATILRLEQEERQRRMQQEYQATGLDEKHGTPEYGLSTVAATPKRITSTAGTTPEYGLSTVAATPKRVTSTAGTTPGYGLSRATRSSDSSSALNKPEYYSARPAILPSVQEDVWIESDEDDDEI